MSSFSQSPKGTKKAETSSASPRRRRSQTVDAKVAASARVQQQKAYKDGVEQSPRVLDQEASFADLFSPDGKAVTQRKLKNTSADVVPTPAEAVKRATGVVVGKQLLPGGQPANSVPRPRKVEAEVDSATLRKDERAKDGILSKVTAMARAEQRILQGTDMQKFYDAGHLVGDQLVGRKIDSFEYWNLAPQISSFNTPAYSAVENEIRTLAETKGATVSMQVEVGYPGDYSVPVGHLKKRGIVPSTITTPDTTPVQIHRRIPNKWALRAEVAGKKGTAQAPTVSGPAALTSPTLGQAFKMAHARGLEPTGDVMGHEVSGEQWAPSEEIQSGDILSILAKTFEDLGSADDIARRILTPNKQIVPEAKIALIKQAAGEVALSFMALADSFSSMKDASVMQEYLELARGPIEQFIVEAQKQDDLGHAAHYLITAKGWVEAIREKSEELTQEQNELFFLTLTQEHEMRTKSPEAQYAKAFDLSIAQSTPQFFESNPKKAEETEQARSQLMDFRGKYFANYPHESGGELMMQHFGPPGVLKNQALLLDNQHIVYVDDVTMEVTLEGIQTGRWHIKYRHQ